MSRRSVADAAYRMLRAAIVQGDLPPGLFLPETEVAQVLGVSRTPVREALSRLELEGFVVRGDNGRLSVMRLEPSQINDIFDLRIELECYGVALAAERISPEELERAEGLATRKMTALHTDDIAGLAAMNRELHDVIIAAARNGALIDLVADLRRRMFGMTLFAVGNADERKHFILEHQQLNEYLRHGDALGASELMRAHLERAREILLDGFADTYHADVLSPVARGLQAVQ